VTSANLVEVGFLLVLYFGSLVAIQLLPGSHVGKISAALAVTLFVAASYGIPRLALDTYHWLLFLSAIVCAVTVGILAGSFLRGLVRRDAWRQVEPWLWAVPVSAVGLWIAGVIAAEMANAFSRATVYGALLR
jgi:hypothetical protein